ncbi:cytochrome P450 6a2-like [Diabrotica undecimpunctata]|uniref:cytochrome P450 6a2-like n=1 Tax=Diabrotica undecimpunctata TaxID=50387 RepID=UPI003B6353D8
MLLLFLLFLPLAIYVYQKWHYDYWKRRGVYQVQPHFLYGNLKDFSNGNLCISDQLKKLYNEFKSKGLRYGGYYAFMKPTFMPIDVNIVKNILQKDFGHFVNRGIYFNKKRSPLSEHLFTLEGEKWKILRGKLTPTFTTGKMKMMFPIMVACSENLTVILKKDVMLQDAVDIKEIVSRFTTDIIISAAFGIECNSLKNSDSEFRKFGRRVFEPGRWEQFKRQMSNSFPKWFLDAIRISLLDHETEDFFMEAVKRTVRYREENTVYRNDFMQLLLELRNKGKISDDHDVTSVGKNDCNSHFLSLSEVAAQCFAFFIGGFETSATATAFTMLELAMNLEIQDKLRKEINTVLEKYDNEITYEGIMEMTYLDKIVHESLRMHPTASEIGRICNSEYNIPGTDLVIEKGVRVIVPILALHRNSDHYPDPDVFDPERFDEENKAKRHPFAYIPFGEGPRMCIASRLGLLQTKVGIVAIVKNFSVTLNKKTQLPIKYAANAVVTSVAGGIWLNLQSL